MTNKHPCEWYIQMAEMYKKNYDDLVSKIHEKIEELDEQGEYDFKHAYPSPCTDTQIDLLKSLLENKKL